jgi:hypothetical protein
MAAGAIHLDSEHRSTKPASPKEHGQDERLRDLCPFGPLPVWRGKGLGQLRLQVRGDADQHAVLGGQVRTPGLAAAGQRVGQIAAAGAHKNKRLTAPLLTQLLREPRLLRQQPGHGLPDGGAVHVRRHQRPARRLSLRGPRVPRLRAPGRPGRCPAALPDPAQRPAGARRCASGPALAWPPALLLVVCTWRPRAPERPTRAPAPRGSTSASLAHTTPVRRAWWRRG